MSENCDVFTIFPIYGQFGAIWKPGPDAQYVTLIFSLIAFFYLAKTENRTKNSATQFSQYCFE